MWHVLGKVKAFNTRRMYGAEGQRIVYAVLQLSNPYRQVVAFVDRDRGIEGVIDLHFGNLDLISDEWVLRAYDDHHWSGYDYKIIEAFRAAAKSQGVL